MHIKHIHDMIETLSECAKCELDKGIECIDTKEFGEVAEMIADLSKAEYYSKISKAMDTEEYGKTYDYRGAYIAEHHEPHHEMKAKHEEHMTSSKYDMAKHGYKTAKETKDGTHMKCLEEYAREIMEDVMDIVKDMDSAEKTLIRTKLQTLASKIV